MGPPIAGLLTRPLGCGYSGRHGAPLPTRRMRIFVAGASGAIGPPLIAELVRRGHEVTGMTRSEVGARNLAEIGAAVARLNAFDGAAVEQALRDARAEVVIDQL